MNDEPRQIPHSASYEKSVLSSMLKDPERITTTPDLHDELFFVPAHKLLFRRIFALAEAGQPVELIGLRQTMHDEGELDAIGGVTGLAEIFSYATNSGYFERHLGELRRFHALRRALVVADGIAGAAWGLDTQATLEAAGEPVSALHDLIAGTRPRRSTREDFAEMLREWEALCRGEVKPEGVLTSLGLFNQLFGGLNEGETIVVSGYPKTGKSVLASQFLLDACLAGERTLVLSLELSAKQWLSRAFAYASNLPGKAVSKPLEYARDEYGTSKPSKEMLVRAKHGIDALQRNLPIVENLQGPHENQIAAIIRREHRKQPLRVVVLDYIQRMRARPGHDRDSFERVLADAAEHTADLARELGFTLIMGSQLSKEGAAKWSEAINEAADLHLKIDRDKDKKPCGIFVEADRHHGQTGERLDFFLHPKMIRFAHGKPPELEQEEQPATRF